MKKLLGLCLLTLTAACSSTPETKTPDTPEALYIKAYNNLDETAYKKASEGFEKVELEYPYSKWATKSKIMSAYSYYLAKEYDDAIITLDRFIKFHPANIDAPYAYYLKALCYYDQIQATDKEQGNTKNALTALNEVIARFPNTKYADDAKTKISLAVDNIAGQDMEVGRYYLTKESYLAALNRFSNVVKNYKNTPYYAEALYRQAETYTILGLSKEAQTSTSTLLKEFPQSEWATKVKTL